MSDDGIIVIDTPEGIEAYRKLALRGRLKLELMGIRFKGRSALTILRSEYGVEAHTKKDALHEWDVRLRKEGLLHD